MYVGWRSESIRNTVKKTPTRGMGPGTRCNGPGARRRSPEKTDSDSEEGMQQWF